MTKTILAAIAVSLASCTVGPNYKKPDNTDVTPAQWRWQPAAPRKRNVTAALKAYAALTTSAEPASPPGTCVTATSHSTPGRADGGRIHARSIRARI